jgi:hypothetical protein
LECPKGIGTPDAGVGTGVGKGMDMRVKFETIVKHLPAMNRRVRRAKICLKYSKHV